jgi:CHASE2 domain-containing sensor protein
MMKTFTLLIFIFVFFGRCESPSIHLVNTVDPDIVLINIEKGNRAFIGELLLKIDSLQPILIGLNACFVNKKDGSQDSVLAQALRKIPNDILVYINDEGKFIQSDTLFNSLASETGLLQYDHKLGLISHMTPRRKVANNLHESFALKIVKKWKPELVPDFAENEEVAINYTRDIKKFFHLDGSLLLHTNISDLDFSNKVFLLGYLGPENEDKNFTPLRLAGKYKGNEPDTYGVVIIANEIRTILDYKK